MKSASVYYDSKCLGPLCPDTAETEMFVVESIFFKLLSAELDRLTGSKVPKWCLVFLRVMLWLDCLKSKPFIDEQSALQSKEKLSGAMRHTFIFCPFLSYAHSCCMTGEPETEWSQCGSFGNVFEVTRNNERWVGEISGGRGVCVLTACTELSP